MKLEIIGPRGEPSNTFGTIIAHNGTIWMGGFATHAYELALIRGWKPHFDWRLDRRSRWFVCVFGWIGVVIVSGGVTFLDYKGTSRAR